MNLTQEQKILKSVLQKAWEDVTFRKKLVEDPQNTIEVFAGVKIKMPEGKTLIVNDQTDSSKVYVNIPEEPTFDNMELGEEQLEAIAGGVQFPWGNFTDSIYPTIGDLIKIIQ